MWKRERLYQILKQEDLHTKHSLFLKTKYDKDFDNYLYRGIGYQALNMLIVGLFYSPYAVTSLREYFANGFEAFFLNKNKELKDICPVTWSKIDNLVDIDLGSYQYES